ncbi:MAG: exo-alpha-sialidase [Planctomycetota bacterium]
MLPRISQSVVIVFYILFASCLLASGAPDDRAFKIFDSTEVDYQPSIIRVEPSGDLLMIFERLVPPTLRGDMYVTTSTDNGLTWTSPQPALATALDERHPSLIQASSNLYLLFYLAFSTNDYYIYRATSNDGITWTSQGKIDLGWATKGDANPCVIREADGSLTMAYQRISGRCYMARSLDNGVTWDLLKTELTNTNAQLPRIAKRESDGRYMLTYQTGSTPCYMWSKTTLDPYAWPLSGTVFDTNTNAHDSQPMVLEGGMFLVTYAQATTLYFDACYRTSFDGTIWSDCVKITTDPSHYDTQPHAIRQGTAGRIMVVWSKQQGAGAYNDHDLYIEPELPVPLPLWLDAETVSAATGGTVNLTLDAGMSKAGRTYLMLTGASGTDPGTALPGGTSTLPINWDGMTDIGLSLLNTAVFPNFYGALDAAGQGTAQVNTLGPLPPTAIGALLYFAYCLDYPWEFVSNPTLVKIAP